jgi:nucleotide-binding universal stress UspA family protein
MKKVKNILVPTDFSVTSRNAYHYAKKLAETLDATITVVHVREYFMPMSEIPVITPIYDREESNLAEDMENFIIEEDTKDNLIVLKNRVKTLILEGDIVDNLIALSESNQTDLIVLGTTGLQDFLTKIIGSTSLKLANQVNCPVILVPRDARFHKIEKIMYASNYESTTPKMVADIIDFAVSLGAAIHFVHVEDFSAGIENKMTEIVWEELFSLIEDSPSFEVHSIYGNDKIEELQKYTEKNNLNLMAFVSKHRNFWENLIHKSVTNNLAVSSNIPMMVMHLDDGE